MEVNKRILKMLEDGNHLEANKSVGLCFCSYTEYEDIVEYYNNAYKFEWVSAIQNEEWTWLRTLKVDVIYADINFIGEKDPSVFELYGALKPGGVLVLKCYTQFNASEVLASFFNYTPGDLSGVDMENSFVLIHKAFKV